MQCLIAGCGYLGQRVAQRWLQKSYTVSALTRSAESAEKLQTLGIVPVLGDVTQPETLTQLPDVDVMLYAVGFDRRASHTRHEVYVKGLDNVLNAMAGRVKRIVYISSSSVYGITDGAWIDEETSCQPNTPGGEACWAAENVLASHVNKNLESTSHVILRLSGIYGPGRLLRRKEELEQQLPISGRADAFLNLIHVDDAAEVAFVAAEAAPSQSLYLVSDDQPVTRREYYTQLSKSFGTPDPVFAESGAADQSRVQGLGKRCSNQRLKDDLKIELTYPTIFEGVPQAIGENS